ncbi:MAG: putative efflux protein family [Planctomycetota bacterium]|nr:putative efflux protein family [Planctomycetota bacterium]
MAVLVEEEDAPPRVVVGQPIVRQVVMLALPVLVEQTLAYFLGVSDTVLTGRYLTDSDLAAVTVGTYLMWFLASLMMIVSAGATALIARRVGEGNFPAATRVCQQAIGLAWIVGMALAVGGWFAAPAIVHAMNLRGAAEVEATAFLRIILLVTPLLASEIVGVAALRGAGDTRTGMYVMLVINLVNAGLSWALVTGFAGLPRCGLRGVATGTAIGEGLGGVILLILLARGRSGLHLDWRGLLPRSDDVRRIFRISLPAAGESLTNGICQLWFLGLINRLGETATAAHGVAIRCEAIAFLTVQAFAVAAGTLTGQYLGANRPDLAAKAARTAWWLGVLVISSLGLIIYIRADWMFSLFLGNRPSSVAAMGVPVLRIVAFALPALATINVLTGSLRGAGDTRWPWLIVIFGYFAVRIPLTYLFTLPTSAGGLGYGLSGAWLAMLIDLFVRGSLVAGRFVQGGWKEIRV